MTINNIANDIIADLCPNLNSDNEDKAISNFIYELSQEKDVTSLRLLICIGIDVKNSIAYTGARESAQNTYISNLKSCILRAANCTINTSSFPTGLTARWKFTWSLNQIPLEMRKPCIKGGGTNQFAKVSSFRNYMYYIVEPNRPFNAGIDIISTAAHDLSRYYNEFTSSQKKYTTINVSRLSHIRFLFVVDINEIKSTGYHNIADIIDGLGFYVENVSTTDNYILFEYDSNFNETTWQPDSLTGDWGKIDFRDHQNGNDFFMSYYHFDLWGRTFSVSGNNLNFKERVHLPFDSAGVVLYKMNAVDLKNLSSNIQKCSDNAIINESLVRYVKACNL